MQNKIQLIAETTRANGKRSYIVPPNKTLSDGDIASFITEASTNKPQADNYISVSNQDAQLKLGKIGHEILVLVGVDGLSSQEREQALQFLNQCLKDMENLVTQKIEWHIEEQELFLKRAELAQWENDLKHLLFKEPQNKINKNDNTGVFDHSSSNQSNRGIWWLLSIIVIVMLLGATCFFLPACNVLLTKPPATVEKTQVHPYKDLAQSLCELYKWCDNNTEQALRSEFDKDQLIDISEKLNQPWKFLTSSLNNKVYLEDLVDFDKGDFQQIIAQQQKLRNGFAVIQLVDTFSLEPLDSEEYPVLSFLYKMKKAYKKVPEDRTELPFFTKKDVKKAQVLASIIKEARANNLIDNSVNTKVFESLCLLTNEKTVDVLYNRENQVRKMCIIPNKDFPTERKCERIETEEQKTQAQVFLKIRTELNKALACGS